jgi:glutamate/tyrosine decarboxylase-like PLP-dependent enzyme
VIATAGTVNTGAFDDIAAIADLCAEQALWLHVDGAFGAWACLAEPPWRDLSRGIERADSLAFDFHKWISVPYDAGCLLVRDGEVHRAAFTERPNYLTSAQRGLAAGEPWPTDFGIDLSRGFRALKVWMTFKRYGVSRLGRMIAKNCRCAQYLADLIARSASFEVAAPVALNICCFTLKNADQAERSDRVIARLVEELQVSGVAAPSTTRIDGRLCVRVAILNHRTELSDLDLLVEAAERMLPGLAA